MCAVDSVSTLRYRYRVSVLNAFSDAEDWTMKACGVLRFNLRKRVDELASQGYDRDATILIERDPPMVRERESDRRYYGMARQRIEHPHRHIPRPGRVEHYPMFPEAEA